MVDSEYEMVREGIDEATGYVYQIKATTHEISNNESGRVFAVDYVYRHQYDDVDDFIVHICGGARESDRESFIEELESEGVPSAACTHVAILVFDFIYKVTEGGEAVETDACVVIELLGMLEERCFGWTPTSEEALEKLERVTNTMEGETCVVCLDEISSSSSSSSSLSSSHAIKMPCSHVYHEDCVLAWLENNSVCPLCRFKLPSASTEDPQQRLQD